MSDLAIRPDAGEHPLRITFAQKVSDPIRALNRKTLQS